MSVAQDEINRAVYFEQTVLRHYLSEALDPAEVTCLLKYQPDFAFKSLLDVGVGTGRTTHFLHSLAARYEAIDYSPVMVEYMKRRFPGVSVRQADWCKLNCFGDGEFDFVFAPCNVIDVLSPESRLLALAESRRVLKPGGLFACASHNRNFLPAQSGPRMRWTLNPVKLATNGLKFLKRTNNHRRVVKLRQSTADYALLNDEGHDYACLHYYITRDTMRAQLAAAGFYLLDVIARNGYIIPEGSSDAANPNLLYVSRRIN
jgi:SAM-dependent methyltransferase